MRAFGLGNLRVHEESTQTRPGKGSWSDPETEPRTPSNANLHHHEPDQAVTKDE